MVAREEPPLPPMGILSSEGVRKSAKKFLSPKNHHYRLWG
jgi:hypothetical protein